MHIPNITWPTTIEEATAIQNNLRQQVRLTDDFPNPPATVAGIDVGFEDAGNTTRAAIVVLTFPDLQPIAESLAKVPTTFPYVPGYLSFRETPAILQALSTLSVEPDILLIDGQGIAHPRRFGIACHLGVLLDKPTLGIAKSILTVRHDLVPDEKFAQSPLTQRGETIGAALRTRPGTKPVFISPGHRMSIKAAVDLVIACTGRYRIPETTRHAHRLASQRKNE